MIYRSYRKYRYKLKIGEPIEIPVKNKSLLDLVEGFKTKNSIENLDIEDWLEENVKIYDQTTEDMVPNEKIRLCLVTINAYKGKIRQDHPIMVSTSLVNQLLSDRSNKIIPATFEDLLTLGTDFEMKEILRKINKTQLVSTGSIFHYLGWVTFAAYNRQNGNVLLRDYDQNWNVKIAALLCRAF